MIDDETNVRELMEALRGHLPMRVYATRPLVEAARQEGADINVNDVVEIDSILYLGDVGGIACATKLRGDKTVVITSLTHLRIDHEHPLAKRMQAYQLRRLQRLGKRTRRSSKK